jgi:hypothetical protein
MRVFLAPPFLLLAYAACTELKTPAALLDGMDASTQTQGMDADPTDSPDATTLDSPLDSPCGTVQDLWTAANKTDPACAKRKVFRLENWTTGADRPLWARSLRIARTTGGRIGIVYNGQTGLDEGMLRALVFSAPTDPPSARTALTESDSLGQNAGAAAAIAVGPAGDEALHLVYQRDFDRLGGDVLYRRIGTDNLFTQEELVTAAVGSDTRLSVAVSPITQDVVASYFVPPTTAVDGALRTRQRAKSNGVWGTPKAVASDFARQTPAGSGQHIARFDATGTASIAYNYSRDLFSSQPLLAQFVADAWGNFKTVDNNTPDGVAGYSVDLSILGDTKIVAYFAQKAGVKTAELRLARWTLASQMPTIDVRVQGVYADPASPPRHSLALATDAFGLVHIAYVQPGNPTECSIYYQRESRVSGQVRWVEDTVATGLPCTETPSVRVALTVDSASRPHIVYTVAGSGVYYATRYDR